jgi:hypothetical protein
MLLATALGCLFAGMVALVAATAVLVSRLRDGHVELYERLDRPGPLYFVGPQWMFSGKLATFVWSKEAKSAADRVLTSSIFWVRVFTGLILLALVLLFTYSVS